LSIVDWQLPIVDWQLRIVDVELHIVDVELCIVRSQLCEQDSHFRAVANAMGALKWNKKLICLPFVWIFDSSTKINHPSSI
jgi:hypothetical protein